MKTFLNGYTCIICGKVGHSLEFFTLLNSNCCVCTHCKDYIYYGLYSNHNDDDEIEVIIIRCWFERLGYFQNENNFE